MIVTEVNNLAGAPVDVERLRRAVEQTLGAEHVAHAEVSLAIVDDGTMAELNLRYLQHEGPTDVLSFRLDTDDPGAEQQRLEGEIIVSADTGRRGAARSGWTLDDELLLYVIHGALHLVGYDDATPEDRGRMRAAERRRLAAFDPELEGRHAATAELPAGDT